MFSVEVDSPFAWAAVFGGFIANFFLGGLAKSYGIILEAYQEELRAPTAYFTLTGGVLYMLMFVLSLPNHFIVEKIGNRTVVMIGGIGSCLSLILASKAPNVTVWGIAIGGGLGFSFSCVYFNIFSVVGQCFKKKLGLANGLSVAGVSIGQMAFPSLVTYLLNNYGVRNGTIVMAGLALHICITAVLMPSVIIVPESPSKDTSFSTNCDSTEKLKLISTVEGEMSHLKLNGDHFDDNKEISNINSTSTITSISSQQSRIATSLLIIYILGKVFADNADVGISFIAPPYGTQIGFTSQMTSLAIAVSGAADLVSRVAFGWLTDQPICAGKRGLFLGLIWFIESLNAIGFGQLAGVPWVVGPSKIVQQLFLTSELTTTDYVGYFVCFAIHGVCSGTAMTQMVVVLSDWVGPKRLAKSLAIMMVVLGLVYVPSQYVLGHLNDICGTYAWSMRLCGLWLFLGSCFFMLEYPIQHWLQSSSSQSNEEEMTKLGALNRRENLLSSKANNGVVQSDDSNLLKTALLPNDDNVPISIKGSRQSTLNTPIQIPIVSDSLIV